ncbi:MAG: tRNA 5-methoxyuridine(34)/uridine 5-oxyacetic acid(34) synthase CmoB [Methylomonas sp.]
MIEYTELYNALKVAGAEEWARIMPNQLERVFANQSHGDLPRWQSLVDDLSVLVAGDIDLLNQVRIGSEHDLSADQQQNLYDKLKGLHPWRKGPYQLFGINIDTEWRSDWKWSRLSQHISPLKNRLVLDVGCGNGYHCWRMYGAGAKLVLGIDPTMLSVMQFKAIRKLHGEAPVYVLPLGIEDVPLETKVFDTVFSMGVLYHRRSPLEHLMELKGCLRPGGELILETLIVNGDVNTVLVPENRYAQMRNVWFLPSAEMLMLWMRRCGFKSIRLVNVTKTTIEEQRSTEWMQFYSLENFLDKDNQDLTCEGLPAPVRAIVIAEVD